MRIFVNKSMLDDPCHDILEGNGVVVFDDGDSVADAISWLCANYTTLLKHFKDLWKLSSWAVVVPNVAAVWVRLRPTSVDVCSCHAWRDASKHGKKARNSAVWLQFDGNHSDAEMIEKAFGKAAKRDVLCCKALGTRLFTVEDGLKLVEKTEDDFVECVSLSDFVEAPDVEPTVDDAELVSVEPVEVEHDGVVDVELAETSETIPVVEAGTAEAGTAEAGTADAGTAQADSLSNDDLIEVIANARKVLADRETRAVESAPVLPAECDAVTQEIPEVPPQTNEDARVLQVSEHVIPACVTLKEYELTRNVPRKHCKQFRDARGRKCAYVVSADGGAFILWRDWYKHDDAELDAAVRAYYAQVA